MADPRSEFIIDEMITNRTARFFPTVWRRKEIIIYVPDPDRINKWHLTSGYKLNKVAQPFNVGGDYFLYGSVYENQMRKCLEISNKTLINELKRRINNAESSNLFGINQEEFLKLVYEKSMDKTLECLRSLVEDEKWGPDIRHITDNLYKKMDAHFAEVGQDLFDIALLGFGGGSQGIREQINRSTSIKDFIYKFSSLRVDHTRNFIKEGGRVVYNDLNKVLRYNRYRASIIDQNIQNIKGHVLDNAFNALETATLDKTKEVLDQSNKSDEKYDANTINFILDKMGIKNTKTKIAANALYSKTGFWGKVADIAIQLPMALGRGWEARVELEDRLTTHEELIKIREHVKTSLLDDIPHSSNFYFPNLLKYFSPKEYTALWEEIFPDKYHYPPGDTVFTKDFFVGYYMNYMRVYLLKRKYFGGQLTRGLSFSQKDSHYYSWIGGQRF